MSNKSIDSKIRGLEARFNAVNENRDRPNPSFTNDNGGKVLPPRPDALRRPNPPGAMAPRSRPRQPLNLPMSAYVPSRDLETEQKLREIYTMSGKLNIEGVLYQSEIKDLDHLGELGSGTCGHVVKMLHKPSGTIIAVKQMRRSGNCEENKRILMDLDVVLRSHGCPYIVKCLGCFITDTDVWICMELMASCFDKLLKRLSKPIPEEILGKVTVATVNALSYLKEEHGVIHRDVKPSNILIDERGNVKLCDFGISGRLVDSKAKTRSAGCAAYMAPERIDPPDPSKPDYDIRADVWSLGISLVELATGIFPYKDCQNDFEVLTKVIEEDPPSLPDTQLFSQEFKLFVHQCLTKDFKHRPKYTKLLEHPFVKKSLAMEVRVDSWYLTIEATPQPGVPARMASPPVCRIVPNQNSIDKPSKVKTMPAAIITQADNAVNGSANGTCDSLSPSNVCSDEDNTSIPNHRLSNSTKENDFESGSYSSMNLDDIADVTMSSAENLSSMKSVDSNSVMARINADRISPTRNVSTEVADAPRMIIWNNVTQPRTLQGSPKDCYVPHRFRSHSNSMQNEQNGAKFPSPNSRIYYANVEARTNPFVNGNRVTSTAVFKIGSEAGDVQDYRRFASPEVARRHVYPSTNPFRTSQDGTTETQAFVPQHGYDIEGSPTSAERPPMPQFRAQGPTSYFTSAAACSNLRFGPPAGSYNYNAGGSCSQPASLEGYSDSRSNFSPYTRRRTLEQCMSPPPRPGALDRRRAVPQPPASSLPPANIIEQSRIPLCQGNTSPIVLQRFYHQQSQQRRSRADLNDSGTRNRSFSRDHSNGRSPEPPPRTSRDSGGGSRLHLVEGQADLLHQRLESDPRIPRYNPSPSLERDKYTGDYLHERDRGHMHSPLLNYDERKHLTASPDLGRLESEKNASLGRCFDGRTSRNREKWEANGHCDDHEKMRTGTHSTHKKSITKDKDEQGWLNSIAGIVKRRFTSYVKTHLGTNNSSNANRSTSPVRLIGGGHFVRCGHRQRRDDADIDELKLKLQQQRDSGPSILTRYGCATPQLSRQRPPLSIAQTGTSSGFSWSVPASPRPTPRPAPLRNLLHHRPD